MCKRHQLVCGANSPVSIARFSHTFTHTLVLVQEWQLASYILIFCAGTATCPVYKVAGYSWSAMWCAKLRTISFYFLSLLFAIEWVNGERQLFYPEESKDQSVQSTQRRIRDKTLTPTCVHDEVR